jgi:hypothetical protein
MELNFQNWDSEQKRRRNEYWKKLQMARADFFNNTVETEHPTTSAFYYHMQSKWGVKMTLDNNQNITQSYEIVDEPKYLMFLMKYGN